MSKAVSSRPPVFTIAVHTVRGYFKERILFVVLIFTFVLMMASYILAPMAVGAQHKIIIDIGLAAISIFGVLLVVLLGAGSYARERDRGILLAVLVKPVVIRIGEPHHIRLEPADWAAGPTLGKPLGTRERTREERNSMVPERRIMSIRPEEIPEGGGSSKGPVFGPCQIGVDPATHKNRGEFANIPAVHVGRHPLFHDQVYTAICIVDVTGSLMPDLTVRQFHRIRPGVPVIVRSDDD